MRAPERKCRVWDPRPGQDGSRVSLDKAHHHFPVNLQWPRVVVISITTHLRQAACEGRRFTLAPRVGGSRYKMGWPRWFGHQMRLENGQGTVCAQEGSRGQPGSREAGPSSAFITNPLLGTPFKSTPRRPGDPGPPLNTVIRFSFPHLSTSNF